MAANVAFAILVIAFGAGTVGLGWWAVPAIGLIWGVVMPSTVRTGLHAAAGAGLAWGLLLVWTATQGPVGAIARRVGSVFETPTVVFFLLPPLLAALLAGSASIVAGALTPPRDRQAKKK